MSASLLNVVTTASRIHTINICMRTHLQTLNLKNGNFPTVCAPTLVCCPAPAAGPLGSVLSSEEGPRLVQRPPWLVAAWIQSKSIKPSLLDSAPKKRRCFYVSGKRLHVGSRGIFS